MIRTGRGCMGGGRVGRDSRLCGCGGVGCGGVGCGMGWDVFVKYRWDGIVYDR